MKKRNIEIRGNHHCQTDNFQVRPFLLAVASLWQLAGGKSINISKKIGGIIDKAIRRKIIFIYNEPGKFIFKK
ncbi:hypothetical protein P378_01890 [Desulforamulus profundi]|uniref:Uncharacterized protein n=1 Tax=Desulforamulus profundi TaxID=1383067 RepID=A0A2C6L498_9FIRM|nr:hypothetical protein P378_01890 [Desulforamulus profundi]